MAFPTAMNNAAEVSRLNELRQNFKAWFLEQIKSKWKIALLSLVAAWIVTTLTSDLSTHYFTKITLIATGRKTSNHAKATVIWLKTPRIAELRQKNFEILKSKGWIEWDGIFISNRDQPAELRLEGYFPRDQVLRFSHTRYSGEAKLEVNGKTTTLDLYSETPGPLTIPLEQYLSDQDRSVIRVFVSYFAAFMKHTLLLLFLGIVLHPIYRKLPYPQPSPIKFEIRKTPRGAIYLMALSIAILLLFMAAYYPGVMSFDAYQQYMEGVLFQFNDWHPPIMALLWSFINKIIPGAAGMFLLHLMMGIGSFYLLSRVALLREKKLYFLPLFTIFLPIVSCMISNIIKDVSSALSLLFAFSLWYFSVSVGKLTRPKLLFILVILFYGSSVRLNALPAAVPLLFLIMKNFTSTRKAVLSTLFIAMLFHASNDFLTYRLLNARRTYPIQPVISHNLMGIYRITGKNYFPSSYLKKDHLDSLMMRYSPKSYDPTTFVKDRYMTRDAGVISELKDAWVSAILHEPGAYLIHRWILFKSFLKDVAYITMHVSHPEPNSLPQRPHPLKQETSLGKLNYGVIFWLYDHARFVYRGITYLIAILVLLAISVYRKSAAAIALNVSSFFYFVPYFFFAPAANYRYVYWCMLAGITSIFVMWFETRRHVDPSREDDLLLML
ncbi:hypothetical protein L0156_06645 [bacterium]|nr:hypothetical protein [bacterium]